MNLNMLKSMYKNKNNINALNIISEIETINQNTNISLNKIITYKLSICTSKTNKKILQLLQSSYPYVGELSLTEIKLLTNKNVNNDELFIKNLQPIESKIIIDNFCNTGIVKSKKNKKHESANPPSINDLKDKS